MSDSLLERLAQRKNAWTVPELSNLLNISKRSVYAQVQAGRLPAYKIGTTVRLCPREVENWLREKAA